MNTVCDTRRQMNELKSILIRFSQSDLHKFYLKGLAASKEDGKPDFYLPLLQEIVREICEENGFEVNEVIRDA